MRRTLQLLLPALLLIVAQLPLSGCGCGFDCNSNNDSNDPASLTLGLSDSLPEDLKQVVIKVDSITLRRSGADNVVIEKFTVPEQGLVDEESFQVNLLNYRGVRQLTVIEDLELPAENYSEVLIAISADGSYVVQQADDNQRPLTVSNGGTLTIPGMQLSSGNQVFTVEFGLAQALKFESANNRYVLSSTGIRIENNLTGAALSGEVDSGLFDIVSPCNEKTTPTAGNRIYLYKGSSIARERLADVFTSASTASPPSNALAPFAVASLMENAQTENWEYAFGYMPAGDYTLAFACNTAADDSVEYNGLTIPQPTEQVYNIKLTKATKSICNLTEAADCR